MSMFNDIAWGTEDNEQECNANADLVSIYAMSVEPEKFTGRIIFMSMFNDIS